MTPPRLRSGGTQLGEGRQNQSHIRLEAAMQVTIEARLMDDLGETAPVRLPVVELARIGQRNPFQCRRRWGRSTAVVDFGRGYRVYFGRDGQHMLVILLVGGTKGRLRLRWRAGRPISGENDRRGRP
jgi:hypothetical protein